MADPDSLAGHTRAALDDIAERLPGGEHRSGQVEMGEAVARAIVDGRHLMVQAGTGTGKSFAYLVPVILSGRRSVVATATKTLQDQLALKDLPFLADTLDHEFSWAVLKGRSNYVCLQRVGELDDPEERLALDMGARSVAEEVDELVRWARRTESGDRAELALEPSHRAWSTVSVGPRECPGQNKCPRGEVCFAEKARRRAAEADLVIVNTHLYGLHLATDGAVLPEHEVVVIDEAHQLEDTVSATSGVELTPGRFTALSRSLGTVLAEPELVAAIDECARLWRDALADDIGERIRSALDGEALRVLDLARSRLDTALAALRRIPDDAPVDTLARKERGVQATTSLIDDLDAVRRVTEGNVAWIEGSPDAPALRLAPIDVASFLDESMWSRQTVVLTSATLPAALADQTGAPADSYDRLDVGSPFDYERRTLLYCAAHLPDPASRGGARDAAVHDELASLIEAAGGRTLALFTSRARLVAAADALEGRVPHPILRQDDLPKAALVRAFARDEATCLFATQGFFQGIDVPGATLSLVALDRIPFPVPTDPLVAARRELHGDRAFSAIDVPAAATKLAQAAGRLIRTGTDLGVVAVLDPRLATKSYGTAVRAALPPMPFTTDRGRALAFLRDRVSRR